MGLWSPILRIFSVIFGFVGFGLGITIGLTVGYYLFIYFQPTDVKVIFCFEFFEFLLLFFWV